MFREEKPLAMLWAADPFEHVVDTHNWHFFEELNIGIHLPFFLTKFTILMLIAGGLMCLIFIPLARRVQSGEPPRGAFWNAFESLLTFIRDQVAKPSIGHDADKFVPFLWTQFLFILFCNLLGLIPFMGSPTASITVTGVLAVIAYLTIHGSAVAKMGAFHYLKTYLPHFDVPSRFLGIVLSIMVGFIEFVGNIIKAVILAVRLFANMFAGHTVLAVILMFIIMVRDQGWYLFWPITVGSVLGVTALSLLELFVAFLQAYIFTFLTALFLGSALHPNH